MGITFNGQKIYLISHGERVWHGYVLQAMPYAPVIEMMGDISTHSSITANGPRVGAKLTHQEVVILLAPKKKEKQNMIDWFFYPLQSSSPFTLSFSLFLRDIIIEIIILTLSCC